jgi:hypothetical protein
MKELFLSVQWRGYEVSIGIQSIGVSNREMRNKGVRLLLFFGIRAEQEGFPCVFSSANANEVTGIPTTCFWSELSIVRGRSIFFSAVYWESLCLGEVCACSRSLSHMWAFIKMKLPRRRLLYSKGPCCVTESTLYAAYSPVPHHDKKARQVFLTKGMGFGAFNLR